MDIGSLMQRQFATVSPSTDLQAAAQALRAGSADCLVVVDLRGRTLGILTLQDVEAARPVVQISADASGSGVVHEQGLHLVPVASAMRTSFPAIGENDDVADAVGKMAEYGVRHVPVLRGSKAVGVVGPSELRAGAFAAARSVPN